MLTDLEIAQSIKPLPIKKIAQRIGLKKEEIQLYGEYKAKVSLSVLERIKKDSLAKYILVTAITPTPLGEGKTVTTIGLSMALNKLKRPSIVCIRQPSLGPVFGIKGGASGGGYSQVIPMEEVNLHLTGDVHAVGVAHNLLAAFLDNSIIKGNPLNIDPKRVYWRRVVDISDRTLRNISIGRDQKIKGYPRNTGFDITVASEVMAILALAKDLKDLKKRLKRIVVAEDYQGNPVTAQNLKVVGAMSALLKEAIKPNLIQTLEHTACFMHAGPFANIAHGNSSIIADKIAFACSDFVVTEAGFGADCGAEKFFDIKCRISGLKPSCAVVVCTVRALKVHSGRFKVTAGRPLDKEICKENLRALEEGFANLEKQIENILIFGIPVVVAVNLFDTDTDREINYILRRALEAGAKRAVISQVWAEGSKGGRALAEAVIEASQEPSRFHFLYPLEASLKEKIFTIATKIYGAKSVRYSSVAEEKIRIFERRGYGRLPICMAKTHLSLSHDPALKGRPKDFILPIRDIRASLGAGFLYPLCGKIQTMPGLPSRPLGEKIDIDEEGRIIGLS